MSEHLRYTIDRVTDAEWQIFDNEQKNSPMTYILFACLVTNADSNVQFTLTKYDATMERPIFDCELWSASFFVADGDQYEKLASEIVDCFDGVNIENPVELAYVFGGCVLSHAVQMPPLPHTH